MKNKMWKTALTVLAAAGAVWAFPGTAMAAPVLPDGIRVQGQDLAGKTCGEARDVIETYEEELGNCPVRRRQPDPPVYGKERSCSGSGRACG